MLPAAGQGIIAVECRDGCEFGFLDAVNDLGSQIRAEAERAFIREMNGGCSAPAAAYCTLNGDMAYITGMDVKNGRVIKKSIKGRAEEAAELGRRLALMIKSEE